jgi:hypothetical protein
MKIRLRRRSAIQKVLVFASPRLLLPPMFAILLIAAAAPAVAQFKSWVAAKFPDTPEGLAVDSKGNLYATLMHTGQVVRIKDDGSYDHIAWVPSREESGQGDLLGLAFDQHDNLYAAYTAQDATITRSGVYKIDGQSKTVTALATKADGWAFCYPDDVAVDSSGNVYLTDLTYSGIWKISANGEKVDLWSADAQLNWPPKPYSGLPLGVNDLVIDKQQKNIYAVTDGNPLVLRIPIKEDGTAGDPVALPSGFTAPPGIMRTIAVRRRRSS